MPKIFELNPKEAVNKIKEKKVSVAIVGFGYIGSCVGAVLADKGINVIGIDTNKEVVKEVNNGSISINEPGLKELIKNCFGAGKLKASSDFSIIESVDIIIVTVGTPLLDNYESDIRHIKSASESVSRHLKKGHIVVLKSTIPPGTTEKLVKPILEKSGLKAGKDFGLVFSPERLAEGSAIKEFTSIPIIIGGIDKKSSDIASSFWKSVLDVETIIVSNPRAAEMAKLADNLWIDLNIALANEIALLCDKLDIDSLEVIDAANTLPKVNYNVNILMPSMGVGGYCLTKDPWFVYSLGKKHGLNLKTPVTSRKVNEHMPVYTYELIKESLEQQGKNIKNSRVAVLGIAFKSNTGDCRFTPAKYTIGLLEKSGCVLSIHDPLVNERDAKTVTKIHLAKTIEEAVKSADCIAFFTGHREFKSFSLKNLKKLANKKCSLIDGRNIFTKDEISSIKELGFIYRGIGRQ